MKNELRHSLKVLDTSQFECQNRMATLGQQIYMCEDNEYKLMLRYDDIGSSCYIALSILVTFHILVIKDLLLDMSRTRFKQHRGTTFVKLSRVIRDIDLYAYAVE